MNIWFTKGFNNLFHAISDIKREVPDCKVLCTHSNSQFLGFYKSDFSEREPNFRTKKEFLEFCTRMIEKYDIKVIFPHHKQEWFNEFVSVFKDLGVTVATVAPLGGVDDINHKNRFYKKTSQIKGLNVPTFSVFKSYEEFKDLCKSDKFKDAHLCIKPALGVYGSDFYDLLDTPLSKKKLEEVISRNTTMLLMEYLNGVEYSADCLAYHGKIVGFAVRKKVSQNLPQIVVDNAVINEQVELLVSKLKLNGMFNVQFKELNGVPYILEINPRLAGRSYYATIAGFNIPATAVKLFLGLEKPENISYEIDYGAKILNVPTGVIVNRESSPFSDYNERESQ